MRFVVTAVCISALVLSTACEDGSAPGNGARPVASGNPAAPGRAPLAIPVPSDDGGVESLAGRELDPFSLPAEFHSASGPLTPSTTTLPVDETYGGSAGFAFRITQEGSGNGGWFRIRSPSSTNRMALLATHTGEGIAARAINTGMGRALWAQIPEPSNPFPALVATHVGSGEALEAINFGSGPAIVGRNRGSGGAGIFEIDNGASSADALRVTTDAGGGSRGIFAFANGLGSVAEFFNFNPSNPSPVLTARASGTGSAGRFIIGNGSSPGTVLESQTVGLGRAGSFFISNTSNGEAALHSRTSGSGHAGHFEITSATSGSSAVLAETNGAGAALQGRNTGQGRAGLFEVQNPSSGADAVSAFTDGHSVSAAVYGESSGDGNAGHFVISNTSSTAEALRVRHNGLGDIAVFRALGNTRARITSSGDVVIDGSFIDTGADLAEAFATESDPSSYGPGDVLAVSTRRNRAVVKSDEAYSTRVIGVYATKPGILLGRESVVGPSGDRIPVAVTGVVPTRVTASNGAIGRGDILVSANRAGYAMKGEPVVIQGREIYPSGAILGKALEPFPGPGAGTILVMVNVK